MLQETCEQKVGQHYACHRENGDATTVATFCSVTLLLVYKNNFGIFPLLPESHGVPAVKGKILQSPM